MHNNLFDSAYYSTPGSESMPQPNFSSAQPTPVQTHRHLSDRDNVALTPVAMTQSSCNSVLQNRVNLGVHVTPKHTHAFKAGSSGNTPKDKKRTQNAFEETQLRHPPPRTVSRGAPGRGSSATGHRGTSTELTGNLQTLQLRAGSEFSDMGRISMGSLSGVPQALPFNGHGAAGGTSSAMGSPQCQHPSASPWGNSHPFDIARASYSAARPPYDDVECSQSLTDISTYVARRITTEFREIRILGSGAFGSVVLCEEMTTGDYVAIKVSAPLNDMQLIDARRERDILNALRGFPHIVHLYNSWEEGKPQSIRMHLQMAFYLGGSLNHIVTKRREEGIRWSEVELLTFLGQMAIALDAVHSVQVAHVDFKPENVVLDECGCYHLGDFGKSLTLGGDGRPRDLPVPVWANNNGCGEDSNAMLCAMSQQSFDEGDKRYIALDMMNEKRYYKAGDMFSLGITLYEMMSSTKLPLSGDVYQTLRNRTQLNELTELGCYSAELVDLVLKLMSRDPLHRPTARYVLQFSSFRVAPTALSINMSSSEDVAYHLRQPSGVISDAEFKFHQTCFEIAHYLMKATYRDVYNTFPPSARRLMRGASVSVAASAAGPADLTSPQRHSVAPTNNTMFEQQQLARSYTCTGEVVSVFRTPNAHRFE